MRLRSLARPCGRAYDLNSRSSLEHRLRSIKCIQSNYAATKVTCGLPLRFCSSVPNLLADIVPTAKDTQKVATISNESKEIVATTKESERATTSKSKRKKSVKKKKAATQKPQAKEETSAKASTEITVENGPVKNAAKLSKVEKSETASSEVVTEVTSPQPSTPPSLPDDNLRITQLESKSNVVIEKLLQISKLQTQLPVMSEIATLLSDLRSNSFEKGNELFDLYRKYGNPSLDEKFLLPGVIACCEANKPKEAITILKDILNQGRHVEPTTFHKVLQTCDETSAAEEVIELWQLMIEANVSLCLDELDTILKICTRAHYLEGAIKVLKELRRMRPISIHTYMHWLYRSSIVWRADIFLDLLVEMRLAGVEPEIPSLTSLESDRKDPALTVMEGVRAVGLDPCYAMASVYSSLQWQVYGNGPAGLAITPKSIKAAKKKFGDLNPIVLNWPTKPIPQVLETQAAGLILQQETFHRLHISQVHRIEKLLKMLPITTNMTINLRKQLQRMSLLVNTHRVRMDMHRISQEYNNGKSLIDLGSAHNYPPVSLMRVILAARGFSTFKIRNALREPNHHLSTRDCEELKRASRFDSIHRSDPSLEARSYNVQSLEETLKAYLHCHGIRFKTEEELGKEQEAKYGRRIISPDILFLDPVIINDTPIRWMDAKNYYGAQIVSKRLIMNQLSSYVKEWGPGAILFGMGFSDKFSVPGVLCLDTAPFPTTAFGKLQLNTKAFMFRVLNQLRWKRHLGSDLSEELAAVVNKEDSEKEKSD